MEEMLRIAAKLAVLVFVVTCMVSAGLGLSVRDVAAPLRRSRLVLLAVLANFVIAPAIAYALTETIPLAPPHAVGLLLLGGAAGAPFLPKLAEAANGDLAFAVGLMLLLTAGSVAFMPFALPLLIPGLSAEPWPILRPLLLTMLFPLAVGAAVRGRSEQVASRLRPGLKRVSNVSMILTLVLLIGANFESLVGILGGGAVASAALFVAATFAVGYALGGPRPATRSVLGLGTGQRNVAAALVVATQNFTDPGVVAMLLASTLIGLIILLLAARYLARLSSPATGVTRPEVAEPPVARSGPIPEEMNR